MLGLYLYTLIIGHKSCNTFSILNKFTLRNILQNFVIKSLFWNKEVKAQQQNKKIKHKNFDIKDTANASLTFHMYF